LPPYRKPPLITARSVWLRLGVSRATFYARIVNDSDFPAPIRPSQRRTLWRPDEIEKYIEMKRDKARQKSARKKVRATP
jgi:predicted DNA-binding transcriptional regulator AlpA